MKTISVAIIVVMMAVALTATEYNREFTALDSCDGNVFWGITPVPLQKLIQFTIEDTMSVLSQFNLPDSLAFQRLAVLSPNAVALIANGNQYFGYDVQQGMVGPVQIESNLSIRRYDENSSVVLASSGVSAFKISLNGQILGAVLNLDQGTPSPFTPICWDIDLILSKAIVGGCWTIFTSDETLSAETLYNDLGDAVIPTLNFGSVAGSRTVGVALGDGCAYSLSTNHPTMGIATFTIVERPYDQSMESRVVNSIPYHYGAPSFIGYNDGYIYQAMGTSVARISVTGGGWETIFQGPYGNNARGLFWRGNKLIVLFEENFIVIQNTVSNNDEVVQQPVIRLDSYPNPFRGSANVTIKQVDNSPTTVAIYNVKGQIIRTLVNNQKLVPGEHSFTWDGKNNNCQPVAAGIYFFKMVSGKYSATRKMILMK